MPRVHQHVRRLDIAVHTSDLARLIRSMRSVPGFSRGGLADPRGLRLDAPPSEHFAGGDDHPLPFGHARSDIVGDPDAVGVAAHLDAAALGIANRTPASP